ncbi:MAG TPA: ABC transporter ATP-binding protein, partial [Candidatus Thioglobus sp.]|nr:ABC transporter ATP-binding protein [Candidatus Thioglobus sp.]
LPFAEMGSSMDLRDVKKLKDYTETRDEILSIIWEMEEEIMGRVEEN